MGHELRSINDSKSNDLTVRNYQNENNDMKRHCERWVPWIAIFILSISCITIGIIYRNERCNIVGMIDTFCSLRGNSLYVQQRFRLDIGVGVGICQAVESCSDQHRCNNINKFYNMNPLYCTSDYAGKNEYILTNIPVTAFSAIVVIVGTSIIAIYLYFRFK